MFKHVVSSDCVTIQAPAEWVWNILIDIRAYPRWNPFTYKVISSLKPGEQVELYVRMPTRGDRIQIEYVRAVMPPCLLSWGMQMGASFFLKALREQRISPCSSQACTYLTTDAFQGILTPLVLYFFGADIRDGFNKVAYALKEEAEHRWKMHQASAASGVLPHESR